ncbi:MULTISPECIES: L-arabinose isomerase [Pasteurella]|nr:MULTISPECIES: L-arabinose isomerase [Pasteurella]MCH4804543.1 L-arabinose isomerase [Pasteurella multocida]MCL7790356.1 L-arabinose isomerase [Pasteurella multocida]MCL7850593.1 L-arabinose isomerase [Pasteurella multocida]MCZ0724468.1 L-arabinose isomerase [Pasteurella multocida]URH93656.1 L-arabinose isomerase [Pasteurella multocida]
MMEFIKKLEIWFVVGSQHLYGQETLQQVKNNAEQIVNYLNQQTPFIQIKLKSLATTPNEILSVCQATNNEEKCVGIIAWMHTFSPAKMWIAGLSQLNKPLLQLHTQFNQYIPWDDIDMNYMNLHQTAHGDREFGYLVSRLRKPRTIIVGHWKSLAVQQKINKWMRVTAAIYDQKHLQIARFGDNMREVSSTEGDKVEAQIKFGYSVNGYGVYQIVEEINQVVKEDIHALVKEYECEYQLADCLQKNGEKRNALFECAKIELGLKTFLQNGDFYAFTDTFENLNGLKQLPGLAVQRLMQQGYGFGAEGDWKTAALVRALKVMSYGLSKGTSFIEDYTYNLDENNEVVLGAHMLEVCPSIAQEKPILDIKPLSIGSKEDPPRLIFTGKTGAAINTTIVDIGNRFRMIVADLDAIEKPKVMPNLPVGHVFWKLQPNFDIGTQAWILAGGAHHSVFSLDIDAEMLRIFAEFFDIEFIHINKNTQLTKLKNELRWNEIAYQ